MHPSRVTDRTQSYERLEFLGDSILGLLVARELFDRYPDAAEGRLSRLRSAIVSRRSCAAVAREIGLDRMFAEQFELTDDLRRSDNVLAALIEAGIAAIVLEVEGPAHDRLFTCEALVAGVPLGTGTGRSKKDAQQAAAEEALAVL